MDSHSKRSFCSGHFTCHTSRDRKTAGYSGSKPYAGAGTGHRSHGKELPPLQNFILPQGTPGCAATHMARAICRRAERRIVALSGLDEIHPAILPYINRLSDYLFVAARWINRREDGAETPWVNGPSAATPGAPTADRMEATLLKLEEEKKKRLTLFEKASSDLNRKKNLAEKLFQKNVDQIRKDGGKVEKPLRDFDLD